MERVLYICEAKYYKLNWYFPLLVWNQPKRQYFVFFLYIPRKSSDDHTSMNKNIDSVTPSSNSGKEKEREREEGFPSLCIWSSAKQYRKPQTKENPTANSLTLLFLSFPLFSFSTPEKFPSLCIVYNIFCF